VACGPTYWLLSGFDAEAACVEELVRVEQDSSGDVVEGSRELAHQRDDGLGFSPLAAVACDLSVVPGIEQGLAPDEALRREVNQRLALAEPRLVSLSSPWCRPLLFSLRLRPSALT